MIGCALCLESTTTRCRRRSRRKCSRFRRQSHSRKTSLCAAMDHRESTRFANRGVPRGTRLNGIYEIDEMIGAGGMGEIYKSHELQTGAAVAIKMLLPDMAENEAALGLFRREAAALHNLPHDAIVRYFLFTVEPTLQRPYLAMEFVDGRSLSEMLQAGPLHFDRLVKLTR